MKKIIKNSTWLFVIAGAIVAADQFTKWLVTSNLGLGEIWSPWDWLTPFARIVHWKNTGVAFGMLQGMNTVFIILGLLVSLGIIYYYPSIPRKDWLIRLALSMELGGAVGNLIDRFNHGYVVDFVSVGDFPVFNVADSCITVGVFVLLLGVWIQEKNQKKADQVKELEKTPDETIN